MRKILNKKSGFTLIELMIVVAILGILAAIAIPAFVTYVRRAKTVEATQNVDAIFKGVASYYNGKGELQARGITGSSFQYCTVVGETNGVVPTDSKQPNTIVANGSFEQIGFRLENSYYLYQIMAPGGAALAGASTCNNLATTTVGYALQAVGNLDADATSSLFEQAVQNNANNEMFRARGFYVNNETE